ncbi:MAG TPA: FecR domain-containing protein [Rhizorhapis sp.]
MRDELKHHEGGMSRYELVREAADLWLRLQADPELQSEVDEWCARSAEHERAFSAAKESWTLAGQLTPSASIPPVRHRSRTSRWHFRPQRPVTAMVGAAAAACLAVVSAPTLLLMWQSDYRTGTGEMRNVTLSDGSSVTLDTGSAIAVNYGDGRRGVRLLAGRAWFDVAHDERHPFTVSAADARVRVTGTAFDVGLDDDSIDVTLARGGVQVAWDDIAPIVLRPGDRIHLARPSHSVDRNRIAISSIGSWRRGRLMIEDVPLSEGIDQLRRYYSGAIVLTSSELGDRRVTGVFDVDDPEEALRLMVRQHGATVRSVTPWLMIVSVD